MSHIVVIAKPRGASEQYQFFKNEETGREWKAAIEAIAVDDGPTNLAPTTLAVTVTVSPIKDGEDGKALRDEENRPIVIDSWTHTFTAVEMKAPDFNPQARIVSIIAERIELGEIKLSGNKKVKDFIDKWEGKNKLKQSPIEFNRERKPE